MVCLCIAWKICYCSIAKVYCVRTLAVECKKVSAIPYAITGPDGIEANDFLLASQDCWDRWPGGIANPIIYKLGSSSAAANVNKNAVLLYL